MNLTTMGSVSSWKRVKMQYLFAAAGIALAVSGAIAVNSREATAPVSSAQPRQTSMSAWHIRPIGQRVIYVLVGSQEQAELVQQGEQIAAGELQSAGTPAPDVRLVVLTRSTEQDVLAIRAAIS